MPRNFMSEPAHEPVTAEPTALEVCDDCGGGFVLETLGQSLCPPCEELTATTDHINTVIDGLVRDYSSDLEDCRGWAEDAIELLEKDRLSKKDKEAALNALQRLRKLATDNAPDPDDYVIE